METICIYVMLLFAISTKKKQQMSERVGWLRKKLKFQATLMPDSNV